MKKKLSEIASDEETTKAVYAIFRESPRGPVSYKQFKQDLEDPDAIKLLDAFIRICDVLRERGYANQNPTEGDVLLAFDQWEKQADSDTFSAFKAGINFANNLK